MNGATAQLACKVISVSPVQSFTDERGRLVEFASMVVRTVDGTLLKLKVRPKNTELIETATRFMDQDVNLNVQIFPASGFKAEIRALSIAPLGSSSFIGGEEVD